MARAELPDNPLIYLVAGEPSGDQLGAYLMQALKRQTGGRVRFTGLGGDRMAAEGVETLFPIGELALMGLEVLPHLRRLFRRMDEVAADIRMKAPDAVVLIDAQSFTSRVAERLAQRDFPLIQYVAPQVWAWDRKRCAKVARRVDHLLLLLPFEAPYFEDYGLETTFVGHPAAELAHRLGDGLAFRAAHDIPADAPVLCVLCGSRRGEVGRHVDVFGAALERLKDRLPNLHCVAPTVSNVVDLVTEAAAQWPFPTTVVQGADARYGAFAAADVSLAVSGTVTVESAFSDTPTVIAYRAKRFTAEIARYLLTVEFASAVNLVLGKAALPEFIQERCRPDLLAAAVERLFVDGAARTEILTDIAEAKRRLAVPDDLPCERAARAVLDVVSRWSHESR